MWESCDIPESEWDQIREVVGLGLTVPHLKIPLQLAFVGGWCLGVPRRLSKYINNRYEPYSKLSKPLLSQYYLLSPPGPHALRP